ncbi:hypothetical protein [Glutamicibacter sp. X7]
MIIADEIKCEIGSQAAVKGAELFCSTAHPVSSADSQAWAEWANVGVGLIAALVTFIAVLVAINQAAQAKRIAEDGHRQAIERELMSRQLDRYEDFARETVRMMQHIGLEPNDYAALLTDQTHAGNAYLMYLNMDHPDLSETVLQYADLLQGIGRVINDFNTAVVAEEDFDKSVVEWVGKHPRFQSECMQNAAVLVNVLRDFHQKKKTADVATKELREIHAILVSVHKPLLQYYEKDQPVFMRKYA